MASWRIFSKGGPYYGTWEGETRAEALLALHRDAGYGPDRVWLDGDDLGFNSGETRRLCGGVDRWEIEFAADGGDEDGCFKRGVRARERYRRKGVR